VSYSSDGIKNPKSLLSSSRDEYLIIPDCKNDSTNVVIITLSEDVVLDTILITNYEDFSDELQEIILTGSIEFPTEKWVTLGNIYPSQANKLEIQIQNNRMIRYLKVQLIGSHKN